MASISYDGHSFIIDGQATWLVSGRIDFARIPRESWRDRIRAAKQAGLNTIQTTIFWNMHEPQPGVFRFEDQSDLRSFVQMVGEEGLYCSLRPGPFVDSGWDMGGLPAWLLESVRDDPKDSGPIRLREGDPLFLQAVARYLDAVMTQVKGLQITDPRTGPIILIQAEHEWLCHNPAQADTYLEQINRFLRESGCAVPTLNTNNLYQQVGGTIDCWSSDEGDLLANCRQLRTVQSEAPCIVSSLRTASDVVWGEELTDEPAAQDVMRRMAEVTAAGGMFNLDPLCGGTNFRFYGGRKMGDEARFSATSTDGGAPISEGGGKRDKYNQIKRFATFASQYGSLLGNLNAKEHHAVAATGLSIVQQTGSQGSVVFLIPKDGTKVKQTEIVTPDGQHLPVTFGQDSVAWLALDINLGGLATLEATNLRPWAFIDRKLIVLFGPANSEAIVSIDGTLMAGEVPKGNTPLVMGHEGMTVVVLNEKQVDAACIGDEGLYVGIGGLDDEDQPIATNGFASYTLIHLDGTVKTHRIKSATDTAGSAPKLSKWNRADLGEYVSGAAPRYATIAGPRSLEACGADFGYGWYRARFNRTRGRKAEALIPDSGDRLHLNLDGKMKHLAGDAPGASSDPLKVDLQSGENELVFLADNLGRFSEGSLLNDRKGLCGDVLDVKPIKLNKPEFTIEARFDPFELHAYIPNCSVDDRMPFPRYHFNFNLPSKTEIVLVLKGDRPRSVIMANNKPIAIDAGGGVRQTIRIYDPLKKGKNKLTFALFDQIEDPEDCDPREFADVYKVAENLTEKAEWWYARWNLPDESAYEPLPATTPQLPAFYRTEFEAVDSDTPLLLEIRGMSKGQIYINGFNAGRFFVATHTGKEVGPQFRYYLPKAWLNTDEPNELVLFDEHGKHPDKCKLVYDTFGPMGA